MNEITMYDVSLESIKAFKRTWVKAGYPVRFEHLENSECLMLKVRLTPQVFDTDSKAVSYTHLTLPTTPYV